MKCSANITLIFLLVSPLGIAHADQQQDLEKLRMRIVSLQQEMEKISDTKSEAADALRESERAISNSKRKLYKLNKQQHEANLTLAKFQNQRKNIYADMQEQQLFLSKLLHQQYLGGKQEYFRLLLNNNDPNSAARQLKYYEYIVQSRAASLKVMRASLDKLNTVASRTKQQNIELDALKEEQELQNKNLLREKFAHQQMLQKIDFQLKQQRREIGKLQRDENHLAKLIEKLSDIVKEPEAPPSTNKQSANIKPLGNINFSALKGKLPLPVNGKVSNSFGSKRQDSPIMWKGLFFVASSSQAVNVIAPGRVIYADWLRGFGNLLIVDHGAGYMSLYGNNETLYKQVGDEIQTGDTVAAVGNSGGNKDYGLYFELRHKGIPLDPAKWVKGRLPKAR